MKVSAVQHALKTNAGVLEAMANNLKNFAQQLDDQRLQIKDYQIYQADKLRHFIDTRFIFDTDKKVYVTNTNLRKALNQYRQELNVPAYQLSLISLGRLFEQQYPMICRGRTRTERIWCGIALKPEYKQ